MATAPSGLGVSAPSCARDASGSLGSPGRPRSLRRLPGGCVGWESASPSGMGSLSSWPAGVRARLRREANAGGVTRASSTRARMYAESRGPSATRPPSTASAARPAGSPAGRRRMRLRSARTTFICAG
eukprot:1251868-Pleurochrysis_carterae.AAC.1